MTTHCTAPSPLSTLEVLGPGTSPLTFSAVMFAGEDGAARILKSSCDIPKNQEWMPRQASMQLSSYCHPGHLPLALSACDSLLAIVQESVERLYHMALQNYHCYCRGRPLEFHGGKCDPSKELSSYHMAVAMENSPVSEVETAGSCDQWTKGNHMVMVYQHGDAAAEELNPQISKVDLGLDKTPSMCHSGLPPPHQGVYKGPGEDCNWSVLIQTERPPLVAQCQPRNKASRGNLLLWRTPHWEGSTAQGHCPINGSICSLYWPLIACQFLQFYFKCLSRQAPLFLWVILIGFQATRVAIICSKPFHKASIICPCLL